MLETAIQLGKTIAPYCFFSDFLRSPVLADEYNQCKTDFYAMARNYVIENPNTELTNVLMYRGKLWRLSYGELCYDNDIPVSWAYSDWMLREYGTYVGLTKIITDTEDDFGLSIEGLAKYLKNKGMNIYDVEYWTGISPEQYFMENPTADRISNIWDTEEEILFPLYKNRTLEIK